MVKGLVTAVFTFLCIILSFGPNVTLPFGTGHLVQNLGLLQPHVDIESEFSLIDNL